MDELGTNDNQILTAKAGIKASRTSKDENTKVTRLLDSVDLRQNDNATIKTHEK